ncbi:MAG: winged helix-turn-helix domain-containing protein [Rhodanobacteraceae bacterium]
MSATEKPVYRFGEFELDPDERRLLANGEPVTLTPKAFDMLVLLVEHAGHVVAKDQLMQALWPRGFVDESNLTKHIWLTRKALGEDGHSARFIETVPKRGYRFVASVERHDRAPIAFESMAPIASDESPTAISTAHNTLAATAATSTSPAMPGSFSEGARGREPERHVFAFRASAPAKRPSRRLRASMVVGGFVFGVVAALVLWRLMPDEAAQIVPHNPPGTAVAIVAFNNLSQNAKDAWLGPALGEMLATEISASDRLHAMPDELVRPAGADLPVPLAGGYATRSLATLRKRLGTDYVLSGSYLVSGSGEQPQLRLDLALQDARTGAAVATLVRNGAVADLPALVTSAGDDLRRHLGISPASHDELQRIASAQPPSADVARRIGFALDALQRNDPARARDELLDAVAQAPGYAPTYSYLAQAWSALGYNAKALAAAQQAAAHAQGLPEEQRLQIDAQVQTAQHDWAKAAESARALVKLRPQNPEYRFQLIAALIAGGKPDDAQAELTGALKQLRGPILDDPRIELEQARVAAARSDHKALAAHAERALRQARQRDETGVAAEAGTQLGIARWRLGDGDAAEQALKQARADYAHIGNPHGEAWVDQNLGNAFIESDPERAREAYQRALAGYQAIGDRNGEAAIYSNLANMLWHAGDHDGTEAAIRKSLAIRRETADLTGQAWNLTGLATVELDSAASDEAASNYREAIVLDERAGEHVHRAFALTQYSDLQRLRGDLAEAAATCAQALAGYREARDADGVASGEIQCAQIALDRGDIKAAQADAEQARAGTDAGTLVNVDVLQAQMAIGRGDCTAAMPRLQEAVKLSVANEFVTGEAIAQSQLALCHDALGHDPERDRAATRATALRSRITERLEVIAVDIALDQLRGQTGHSDEAVAMLRNLAEDADKRRWLAWSLEARLAAVQLLYRAKDPRVPAQRGELQRIASAHGFAWILSRLPASPLAR